MDIWLWVAIASTAIAALLYLSLPNLIFQLYTRYQRYPNRRDPGELGLEFIKLQFSSQETLHSAWLIMPPGHDNYQSLATVIMPHGYAANREQILERCCYIARAGFAVFTFDWRRCGESQGERISLGLLEKDDLLNAIDFVKTLPHVDNSRLALYGFSMGAATSVVAACQCPDIKCLVADSPFSSIEEITRYTLKQMFIPARLVLNRIRKLFVREFSKNLGEFNVADAVDKIAPRPVLIIGNREDRMVPFFQIEKVFRRAKEPKEFCVNDHGGHFRNASEEILDETIIPFLKAGLN